MKLPPSIEKLLQGRGGYDYEHALAQAIAHEACRLQREACEAHFSPDMTHTPLVVPNPEET